VSDEAEPSLPEVELPPPPERDDDETRTSDEDGSGPAKVLPRRTLAIAVAVVFALGSFTVAYGMFHGGDRDAVDGAEGGAATGSPDPGKGSGSKESRDEQPGQLGERSPKGPGANLKISSLTRTEVEVENIGKDRARSFAVSVANSTFTVEDGLRPDERASFEYACKAGTVTAVADQTDRVEESDETDNSMTAGPFDCKKKKDPSPSDDPPKDGSKEQPDLTVRSLAKDRIVVANIGDGSADAFVVDVGKAGTFNVGRLDPGATKTFHFACSRRPSARVDAGDDVRESNEDNNRRTEGPFECLADLVVSAFDAHNVTIQNIGEGGAGQSIVRIEGNGFRIPAIEPGGQITLGYPCVGGFVHVMADAFEEVTESNEGNNNASGSVGGCLMSTNRHTVRPSVRGVLTWAFVGGPSMTWSSSSDPYVFVKKKK